MAQLQSDQHGFLIGDPIDLGRMPRYLLDIKSDVAAIKRAVIGSTAEPNKQPSVNPPVGKSSTVVNIPVQSRASEHQKTLIERLETSNTLPALDTRGGFVSGINAPSAVESAIKPVAPPTIESAIKPVAPLTVAERLGKAPRKAAVTPTKRDTSGRFTGNGNDESGNESPRDTDGAVTALANRLSALSGIGSGLEEADPTVKAFQEIAEPMKRGFEFFGGGKDDKQTKWLRNILGVLKLSRKEETVYQKATQKTLKAIEGKSVGGADDNGGIMGMLGRFWPILVAAISGIGGLILSGLGAFFAPLAGIGGAIVSGLGAVLSVVFSPIGLAIGAAALVAWGLFTESGQKFFGEVGAKIIAGWDAVTTAFAPITDAISKGWDTVKGGFDSLISGMVSSWDRFTGFLKDKFGIDIPAIFKPVVDVSKKVVESATDAVKGGANIVKETAGKAVDAVAKSSPKTTEALGNGWDKVTEGASKIMSHATGKTAANKAAMLNEMAAQGITDPNEQAMLMAEVDHESGGFTSTREKSHTRASTVMSVSKTAREAGLPAVEAAVAQGGDAVAELMYGGRMGNTEKGDGARFKGRGLIQLTGRANYEAASKDLGIDLVNHPELAESPEVAAKTAVWFWKKNKLGESAKNGDVRANRRGINNGDNGLDDVKNKYGKYLVAANNGEFKTAATEPKPSVASISDDPTQGKPYLDKEAAINSGDMSMYNRLAAGPVNSASMVSAPVPSAPVMPTSPKIADAPPVIEPLSSPEQRPIMVNVAAQDVGQDVSDRKIALIATGGLSG